MDGKDQLPKLTPENAEQYRLMLQDLVHRMEAQLAKNVAKELRKKQPMRQRLLEFPGAGTVLINLSREYNA